MSEACPYCNKKVEVGDEGFYEDETYQQECDHCLKTFVYTGSVSIFYDLEKADCLNGSSHKWKQTITYPKIFTKWMCRDCGDYKELTGEEKEALKKENPETYNP